MSEHTNTDLHRDLGRMEGRLDGVEASLSEVKHITTKGFDRIEARLAAIEARDNERKGAWIALVGIATAAGAIASAIITAIAGHIWK